jgi:hypothetical protein
MREYEEHAAGEGTDPEASGAGADADRAAGTARTDEREEGVLTQVCLKCGTEYYFSGPEPPGELTCEKCGNEVFRSFYSPLGDVVADDFEETTARDLDPDDAEGDAAPGDVLDLNP